MLPFLPSLYIFYGILTISTLAILLLFYIYYQEGQNVLLRSACILILILHILIISGQFAYGRDFDSQLTICAAQASLLNYCLISLQIHGALMMINSCWVALSWRGRWFHNPARRLIFFLAFAYLFPFAPTGLAGYFLSNNRLQIEHRAFFCVLARPRFIVSTVWILIFGLVGSGFSLYLLYRLLNTRIKTLSMGSETSQITWGNIARLSFSSLIYIVASNIVYLPLLSEKRRVVFHTIPEEPSSSFSPWTNPDLCTISRDDFWFTHFQQVRCPTYISFAPVIIGLTFFLMYGFGTPARNLYREFSIRTARTLQLKKRKLSTLPMIEALPSDHTILESSRNEAFQNLDPFFRHSLSDAPISSICSSLCSSVDLLDVGNNDASIEIVLNMPVEEGTECIRRNSTIERKGTTRHSFSDI